MKKGTDRKGYVSFTEGINTHALYIYFSEIVNLEICNHDYYTYVILKLHFDML